MAPSFAAHKRRKIAVLGGGMGSLSFVYALSSQPGWSERYEITVYQLGWRLGGKGASGRNAKANFRNEEHGLHLLFGFYHNTFKLMRECYTELGRTREQPMSEFLAPTQELEARFPERYATRRHDHFCHFERFGGDWESFSLEFARNARLPGDGSGISDVWDYFKIGLRWLKLMNEPSAQDEALFAPNLFTPDLFAPDLSWQRDLAGLAPNLASLAALAILTLPAAGFCTDERSANGVDHLAEAFRRSDRLRSVLSRFIVRRIRRHLRLLWGQLSGRVHEDWEAHQRWTRRDWMGTQLCGILEDGVLEHGFDHLNNEDYAAWLERHGTIKEGTRITLDSSWVRGAYDSCFAYAPNAAHKGQLRPCIEAGTMLRGGLRLNLGYKGAVTWMFNAGCGDLVFAPLYQVLKRRGVHFRFFHEVLNLGLHDEHDAIESVRMRVQASAHDGAYDPLIEVKGLPCWPSAPLWDQLSAGETLRTKAVNFEAAEAADGGSETTLRRGVDFDEVVLGIPVTVLPKICPELLKRSENWRNMSAGIRSTATVSMQLWSQKSASQLRTEPGELNACLGEWPFASYADMTSTGSREAWKARERPGHIAYLVGAIADTLEEHPAPHERAATLGRRCLEGQLRQAWPLAYPDAGRFDWSTLVDPLERAGSERFAAQWVTINEDPSSRYILSVPGSSALRLRAGDSGFDGLTLAGDWIDNGLNSGCMEASVMSGLQACRALTGAPRQVPGEHDFPLADDAQTNQMMLRAAGASAPLISVESRGSDQ